MDRSRWIYFGVGLVVVFFVSMAAGAFIGRQRNESTPPVANVASPSPSPSPQPTLPPTASPTPTLPPTLPPTVPPTAPPEPTAPPDSLSAKGFAQELAFALRESDDEYLFNHLHPAVITRYGEQACRDHVAGMEGDPGWEILGSDGPAPWSYESDEKAAPIDDAWIVSVRQPGADPELRDLHFAQAEGIWRWFTDCGEPA